MDRSIRKLYLVRHAESVWNKERRIQGTCNGIRLSETGRDQARLLGERLITMDFERVYCSSAERAVETARLALGDSKGAAEVATRAVESSQHESVLYLAGRLMLSAGQEELD